MKIPGLPSHPFSTGTGTRILLAVLSGLLLALPYNFPALFLLTWIAFVPILLATEGLSLKRVYGLGILAGLAFYLVAASWITDFIVLFKGFSIGWSWFWSVAFWIYCAQLPALLCVCYRWIGKQLSPSHILLFPALVVIFYSLFPMLFSVQLGESQSRFLIALQAIEFTGVYGLDFLIALTNIIVVFLIRRESLPLTMSVPLALLIIGWFGFGWLSLQHWDQRVANWPRHHIALIQPNETPGTSVPPPTPGFSRSYPIEMAFSEAIVAQGADLIVWPETRFKSYFRDPHIKESFIAQFSSLDTPVMFQDIERARRGDERLLFNTAVLFDPHTQTESTYQKIKRVAFGEYVPLFDYSERVKGWFQDFLGDFFIDFRPGDGPKVFSSGEISFLPLICYEVMFPNFVANGLRTHPDSQLLIGISNNGWFGETRQPWQHLNASFLRSVESRRPLIHAVNNGPSAVVLPSGRVGFQTAYHTTLAATIEVPLADHNTTTLFTRYPCWFVSLMVLLVITIGILEKIAIRRK